MCGLVGFIGEDKLTKQQMDSFIETMKLSSLSRGTDATGILYKKGRRWEVLKKGVSADEFFQNKKVKEDIKGIKSHAIFGHVRHGTGGHEKDNANNHPIIGKRYTVLHNGVVTMNRIHNYKYDGETDTEILVSHLDTFGLKKGLGNISGSASLIIMENKTKKIYLWRTVNPLDVIWDKQNNLLILISDKNLYDNMYAYKDLGGLKLKGQSRDDLFTGETKAQILYEIDLKKRLLKEIEKVEPKRYSYVRYNNHSYGWNKNEYRDNTKVKVRSKKKDMSFEAFLNEDDKKEKSKDKQKDLFNLYD